MATIVLLMLVIGSIVWVLMRLDGFHLITYTDSSTTTLSSADMTALTDQTLSIRNGHYFFTAQFYILGATIFGGAVNRASLNSPTFNAYGKFNVWPLNEATTPSSPPRMDLWTSYPVKMPTGEEIQATVNTTGADTTTMVMILGTEGWHQNLPRGLPPFPIYEVRFTSAITLNALAYTTLGAVTFETSLRSGTYAVCGCQCQGTNLLAFRLVFNRPKFASGIPLRPGNLALAAVGDIPFGMGYLGPLMWGEWGRFATTEYPQLECVGIGTAAITVEGRMWLARVSDSLDVQY